MQILIMLTVMVVMIVRMRSMIKILTCLKDDGARMTRMIVTRVAIPT